MNIPLSLAARYLRGRKLRTALTTLAIVFGVVVIFGMNSMLPAFVQSFQANVLAAAGEVDATITLKTADSFDASAANKVAAVEGVRVVSGALNRTINIPENYYDNNPSLPDAFATVTLMGIHPDDARSLHAFNIKAGRFLQAGDTEAVVISKSLAEALQLGVGSALRLPTAQGETTLTVVGLLPAHVTDGSEEILVTLPQAQAMLGMPNRINTIEANFETIDAARRAEIEAAIVAALGEAYQIGALDPNAELLTNMYVAQAVFNVLGVLALLMGGFIIFNTFRTLVAERRRDIGMLRALGASRTTIFGIILGEGLIQGVIGTLVGLGLGYVLAYAMIRAVNPVMQSFLNMQIGAPVVQPGLVVTSIVIGIGITLLAGLLPAIQATHVTPIEALRPSIGKVSIRRIAGLSFWLGAALIALALGALLTRSTALISLGGVLFLVGLILIAPALVNPIANLFSLLMAVIFARSGTAQLAEGNLSRHPGRAAVTASTTLIAMAIVVMAASMFTSVQIGFSQVLRKSLGSDFLLIPPSVAVWGTNVGAGAELNNQIRAIDGVETVSALRFAPSQVNDVAVSVLGIDPVAYPQVSGLTFTAGDETSAYASLAGGRNAIINAVLATTAGVQVGDSIELLTPNGKIPYRVVAIAGDYLNAKIASVYIAHASLAADFNRTDDVLVQVNLAAQADPAAAEAALKAVVQRYPQFRLISGREFIDDSLELFQVAFAGIFALVIFLAVPSLIAMINTLAIGVIERTREIGMLRAVGATQRQVRTVIVAEALILSGIGTAFGILAGLYLGYLAVEAVRASGFPMEYAFPASGVLITTAAGILFGVLAAIIPARQAARLEIVQALRYE